MVPLDIKFALFYALWHHFKSHAQKVLFIFLSWNIFFLKLRILTFRGGGAFNRFLATYQLLDVTDAFFCYRQFVYTKLLMATVYPCPGDGKGWLIEQIPSSIGNSSGSQSCFGHALSPFFSVFIQTRMGWSKKTGHILLKLPEDFITKW